MINKAYQLGHVPTVVVAQDEINSKKISGSTWPDNKTDHIFCYLPFVPRILVLLQENIVCELDLSNDTADIFHNSPYTPRSKFSGRKRTRLTVSNRKSFPFLSWRRHSPSVWRNCTLTRAHSCLFSN